MNFKLGQLFTDYARQKETEVKYLHFAIDGKALSPETTAESLSLKDFDVITCSPALFFYVTNNRGGTDIAFKVKDTTLMGKVFATYAQKMGILDVTKIVFTIDNKTVGVEETAHSLYLQQDAIIVASYCIIQQLSDLCSSQSLSLPVIEHVFDYGGKPNAISPDTNYDFFLAACKNERVTEGIIARILEYYPSASYHHHTGTLALALHCACSNKNVTIGIVQILVKSNPESVRHHDSSEKIPLHYLMSHNNDKPHILRFLIEQYPMSVRDHPDLIYNFIRCGRSVTFCRLLVAADPGSEQRTSSSGWLPFHLACRWNNVATVKLLYDFYPDAINHAVGAGNQGGRYAIHVALDRLKYFSYRDRQDAVEIVKFLLNCSPDVALQRADTGLRELPLYVACANSAGNTAILESGMAAYNQITKLLFDIHPNAIEELPNEMILEDSFLHKQLQYWEESKDSNMMSTPDDFGRLPLHRALVRGNVALGSTKLLAQANLFALAAPDNNGAIPLHLACHHSLLTGVVQYLIECNERSLDMKDSEENNIMHYACRGAAYATIKLLLDKFGSGKFLSQRNKGGRLPIDLLIYQENVDRSGIHYTECLFNLMRACPETISSVLRIAGGRGVKRKWVTVDG